MLLVLLPACQASPGDYPPRPGGGGPVIIAGGGGSGSGGDAGVGDGGASDAGGLISGRVCIVTDLRTPTTACDTTKNASQIKVTLGTRTTTSPPARTGEFTIEAQLGTELVWHATGTNFIPSVMPFGTDNTIPVVPDTLYMDRLNENNVTLLAEGQGSVVARVVSGLAPVAGVKATTTLASNNAIPRYGAKSDTDWSEAPPTQAVGVLWFPGVDVTTSPARITFTPAVGTAVSVAVNVEDLAITFIVQDVQ